MAAAGARKVGRRGPGGVVIRPPACVDTPQETRMGQAANSNRNASLDDRKTRAAGRNTDRKAIREAVNPPPMKGNTGGAFGGGKTAERSAKPARKRPR